MRPQCGYNVLIKCLISDLVLIHIGAKMSRLGMVQMDFWPHRLGD